MKQSKKIRFLFSLLLCLCVFPGRSFAEGIEVEMQNEVGITFENDYTPEEPSVPIPSESDQPTQPTGSNDVPPGKKPNFPQAGEANNKHYAGIGIISILLAIGLFLWQRKKVVNK